MKLAIVTLTALGLSGCCTAEHVHRYRVATYEAPQVRSYVHKPTAPRRRMTRARSDPIPPPYRPPQVALQDGCAASVRVVGPDAWTQRGAAIKARRAWVSQVRFDLGERFADLARAKEVDVSCVRASTNESTVGKVGKAFVGPLAVRDRCVVVARPCEG